MFRNALGKTFRFLGYAVQYGCVAHCAFEYLGGIVVVTFHFYDFKRCNNCNTKPVIFQNAVISVFFIFKFFFLSVFSKKKIKKLSFLDKLVLQASLKQMGSNMSKHFAESTFFQKGQSSKIPTLQISGRFMLLLPSPDIAAGDNGFGWELLLQLSWCFSSQRLKTKGWCCFQSVEKVLRCVPRKPLHPAQCRTGSELKEL